MTDNSRRQDVTHKLSAMGWGLFFIWIGAAMFYDFGRGITALGIGAIVLFVQLLRLSNKLKLEKFWIVFGLAFLVVGAWQIFDVQISLLPLLLIIAGAAIIFTTFWHKRT